MSPSIVLNFPASLTPFLQIPCSLRIVADVIGTLFVAESILDKVLSTPSFAEARGIEGNPLTEQMHDELTRLPLLAGHFCISRWYRAVQVGDTRKSAWRLSKNGFVKMALPNRYFTQTLGLVLLG